MPMKEWLLLNLPDFLINKGKIEGWGENMTHIFTYTLLSFSLQAKNCPGFSVNTYMQAQSLQAVDASLLLQS